MAYVTNLTELQARVVLQAFLMQLTGLSMGNVILGQPNRTPTPLNADFIVFTPFARDRLATNQVQFSSSTGTSLDQRGDTQNTRWMVQVDVFGPASPENVQVISTLFRSDVACSYFKTSGLPIFPLYTSDPRQLPFVDESVQVETRWTLDLFFELQPTITSTQDFADSLDIGIISVDARFPPT